MREATGTQMWVAICDRFCSLDYGGLLSCCRHTGRFVAYCSLDFLSRAMGNVSLRLRGRILSRWSDSTTVLAHGARTWKVRTVPRKQHVNFGP